MFLTLVSTKTPAVFFLAKPIDSARFMKLLSCCFFIRTNSPDTCFINSDLIDPDQNLFNGKRSKILSICHLHSAKMGQKNNFRNNDINALRQVVPQKNIHSFRIWITDAEGSFLDFKEKEAFFEIELN